VKHVYLLYVCAKPKPAAASLPHQASPSTDSRRMFN
jgi:hypothetical protein